MKRIFTSTFLALFSISLFSQSAPVFLYLFSGNTEDGTGNNNECVNYGATLTTDRFGNANSAYYFDGESDYMEITPHSDSLKTIRDFSLSLWFKKDGWQQASANTVSKREYLFCGHSGSKEAETNAEIYQPGISLAIDYYKTTLTKTMYEFLYSPQGTYQDNSIAYSISEKWNHVVYVRKGETLYTYYNDTLIDSKDGIDVDINSMFHELYIGTFNGNNPNYYYSGYNFKGCIDDIVLYNRAIDESEIAALFDNYTPSTDTISISGKVTGCTEGGIAILYQKKQGKIEPQRYQDVHNDGTFKFDTLKMAMYYIYIIPSNCLSSYIPTYYSDNIVWSDCNYLQLKYDTIIKINLLELPHYDFDGRCVLSGNIHSEDTLYKNLFRNNMKSTDAYAQNVVVKLLYKGEIIATTTTDNSGNYSFSGVPVGTYQISVEHLGYTSTSCSIAVADTAAAISDINFSIEKSGVTTTRYSLANGSITAYPNPTKDIIRFSDIVDVDVVSSTGVVLAKQKQVSSMDISKLPSGCYFIKLLKGNVESYQMMLKDSK